MASSCKRSQQRQEPERLVADVMREQARHEAAVRAKALFVARLQLANVFAISRGIRLGVAPAADIFGLDEFGRPARGGSSRDQLFGELP
jgi:hypothetical protein